MASLPRDRTILTTSTPTAVIVREGTRRPGHPPFRPAPGKKHSSSLDGLRFTACFLLAVGHLSPEALIGPFANAVLNTGIVSAIFFALSGFILTQTTALWRKSWYSFGVQRFSRLYPAHLAAVAILFPFILLSSNRPPVQEIAHQLALWVTGLQAFQTFTPDSLFWSLNVPAWSITPLLLGSLALPILRVGQVNYWPASRLFALLGGLVAYRIAADFALPFTADRVVLNYRHYAVLPHIAEIFAGATLGILFRNAIPEPLRRFLRRDSTLLLAVGLLLGPLVVATLLGGYAGGYYFVHGPAMPFVFLLLAAVFSNEGRIEAFSKSPAVKTAGDMSIYVFLFHVPVYSILERVLARVGVSYAVQKDYAALIVVAALVLTVAVSWLAVPVFARMRDRVVALFGPRAAAASAAAAA